MFNGFYPRYDLEARIQHTKLDSWGYDIPSARMNRVEEVGTADFSSVMSGLVENLNTQMEAPDNLLKDAMMGNQNVDIHDVMTAMSKAEIAVSVATTVTGKVIQAYDKIMQIQI
jgi:flagellar hook-basal body complex protein FliE